MSKNFIELPGACCWFAGRANPHNAQSIPHAAQLVKLRVMKPLNPIFHRDSGQCQISDVVISDCGFVILDFSILNTILIRVYDFGLFNPKSAIRHPKL
jgi:hypothetical protein